MAKILVLFHSVSEHTWRLAEAVADGARGLEGCEAALRQVPELADAERIFGPGFEAARQAFAHVETATIGDLDACDGLAIGTPVHYGNASSTRRSSSISRAASSASRPASSSRARRVPASKRPSNRSGASWRSTA